MVPVFYLFFVGKNDLCIKQWIPRFKTMKTYPSKFLVGICQPGLSWNSSESQLNQSVGMVPYGAIDKITKLKKWQLYA